MSVYGHFLYQGKARHAEIEGDTAHFIDDLFDNPVRTGETALWAKLTILPTVRPSKLFAIGLNYADHAAEHGNEVPSQPLMWFKAPSAIIGPGETVQIAFPEHRTDYEAELAIVIGKRGKKISESEADDYIFGYTGAQDISDRVVQRSESQWARAKSFDTYAPLGPFIYTNINARDLTVQTLVNGEIKQSGHTRDMIFSPEVIVSFVSQAITLEVGDVILTGTPEGVGPLQAGDVLETRIGHFEPLVNSVGLAA